MLLLVAICVDVRVCHVYLQRLVAGLQPAILATCAPASAAPVTMQLLMASDTTNATLDMGLRRLQDP